MIRLTDSPRPADDTITATIRAALNVLLEPGSVAELRIVNTRQGTVSGYFDNRDKLAAAAAAWDGKAPAIYVTLNPVSPALLARAVNRLEPYAKHTTSDPDILRRRWFGIDVDPVRPSGISATDTEHGAALTQAREISAWLAGQGWPALVVGDSGNGGHLLYRIDLPNDGESRALLARCLAVLALRFSDERVTVDETVFNAARIWKMYGTLTLLEKLAALAPAHPEPAGPEPGERLDIEAWLTKHNLPVVHRGTWNGGRKWVLNPCPWNSDHANRAAYIVQFQNGAIAAGCHHNSCHGKDWHALRDLKEQGWREAKGKRTRAREEKPKQPLPPELAGRRIHPALHFEDDLANIGIVRTRGDGKGVTSIITSDRREYPSEILEQVATTKPLAYTPLVDRWPVEDREAWLQRKTEPASFALAVGAVLALFSRLLDAPMVTLTILACWTVGSYFHRIFPAFARLFLTGERESGKSKAQQIIGGLAFNGLYRVTPNGPPLFRLIDALRPTYCVSEAENLEGEQRQVLQAILAEGYLRGGFVDRCDGESNWEPRPFEVFAPITLGNIKGIRGVMESRTIPLVMVRGTDRSKLNLDVDAEGVAFRAARGLLYRLTLERFRDVAETWRTLPDPGWLVGRERQLWRPLLVLASLADREAGGTLTLVDTITEAAKRQARDRAAPSDEAAALVATLKARLKGAEEIRLHPADLVDDLKSKLHRDHVTPTWAGHLLRRNGFEKPKPPEDRDSEGVFYLITRIQLEVIIARYAIPPEQPTNLHTLETHTSQHTKL